MSVFHALKSFAARFASDEQGSSTIEFVIVFPVFFGFFLMTVEGGIVSLRHVMLEHGVDIAVREVRIGAMPVPTTALLRAKICDASSIIPNCETQLQLELFRRNPRSWVDIPTDVECINRGLASQPVVSFTNGDNNDLMILRVCARFDPILPTSGLGQAIVNANSGSAAQGSYALVSLAAFVVEPFKAEE